MLAPSVRADALCIAGFLHILNHSTGMLSHLHQNTDHCPQSTLSGDAAVSAGQQAALAAGGLEGLLAGGDGGATALAIAGMGSDVAHHHQGPVNLQGHISRLRTDSAAPAAHDHAQDPPTAAQDPPASAQDPPTARQDHAQDPPTAAQDHAPTSVHDLATAAQQDSAAPESRIVKLESVTESVAAVEHQRPQGKGDVAFATVPAGHAATDGTALSADRACAAVPESRIVNAESNLPAEHSAGASAHPSGTADRPRAPDLKRLPEANAAAAALNASTDEPVHASLPPASGTAGERLHALIGNLGRCAAEHAVDLSVTELSADVLACLVAPLRGLTELLGIQPDSDAQPPKSALPAGEERPADDSEHHDGAGIGKLLLKTYGATLTADDGPLELD
jgi:hypothetical protein